MTSSLAFIIVFFLLIVLSFLVFIQQSVDKSKLLATPSIPVERAVFTSYGSTTIPASVDEVFTVLTNFKDYSKWSLLKNHKWQETTVDGVPLVGSKGTCELHIEGFGVRKVPLTLTVLDREKRMIAEYTTGYPNFLLSSERVQEVVPIKGHKDLCEYRSWHTIQGLAGYFLLFIAREDMAEATRDTCDNLKTYLEKKKSSPLSRNAPKSSLVDS